MTRSRAIAGLLALGAAVAAVLAVQGATAGRTARAETRTATPIKHLVVIFQENVSFDHYFGTYPNAANTDGQPFHARPGHAAVNGLARHALLTAQPEPAPTRSGSTAARPGSRKPAAC